MKIITWNINGYRSAQKDNRFSDLLNERDPDIVCLQEVKMNDPLIEDSNYYISYNFAVKKGYSGVAVLSKRKPINVEHTLGVQRFDVEGRYLLLEFDEYVLINIYIPHGGRKKENHPHKFSAIDALIKRVKKINKPLYICTDFNIAHDERDVANFKTNRDNNMFSYEERKKLDELLKLGLVDSFRVIHSEGGIYSMWPNANNARERNMGWRIDYILVSKKLATEITKAEYLCDHLGSDHCPYLIET